MGRLNTVCGTVANVIALVFVVSSSAIAGPPEADAESESVDLSVIEYAQDRIAAGDLRLDAEDYPGAIELWSQALQRLPEKPEYLAYRLALLRKFVRAYVYWHQYQRTDSGHLNDAAKFCSLYLEISPPENSLERRLLNAECNAVSRAVEREGDERSMQESQATQTIGSTKDRASEPVHSVRGSAGRRQYVMGEASAAITAEEVLVQIGHEDLVQRRARQKTLSNGLLIIGGATTGVGLIGISVLLGSGVSLISGDYGGEIAISVISGLGAITMVAGAAVPRGVSRREVDKLIGLYNNKLELGLENPHRDTNGVAEAVRWRLSPSLARRGAGLLLTVQF
jgi:tetratricopeptide (TPR) repeat protein